MLLLLTPYPAYSFSSGWAWSVMAAKCRENGQGSAVLELMAVQCWSSQQCLLVYTENGF